MRVKRYVVDSMPDALQRIRTDLGKDAVILNTKEVRSGGFLGFFGKKKIEVIAATDTGSMSNASPNVHTDGVLLKQQAAIATNLASNLSFRTEQPVVAPMSQASRAEPSVAVMDHRSSIAADPPPQASPQASAGQAAARREPGGREDLLLEEIKMMKEMMLKLSARQQEQDVMPEPLIKIRQRLLDQEVDPMLVYEIMQNVKESIDDGVVWTDELAKQSVKERLNKLLARGYTKSIQTDTRIAHFVGPTGVGKTTTIAKLAAEQVLKHNRKIGFITSDTYRIAAVEQLKTYANILNVPLEVVFSPQELHKVFHNLADCELILMDTAGRNFRNPMYVSELNSLLTSQGKSETFLVLSMASKYSDMKEITNNFSKFKLDKVLFTKMDETKTYGSIINLLHDFPVQLSYLTNGQNVPDDIFEVNEAKLIDLIVEAEADE